MGKAKRQKEVVKKTPFVNQNINASRKIKYTLGLIIAVFALVLYAQSISYNYTLDDHPAIDENRYTTQGILGIPTLLTTDYWYGFKDEFRVPLYRPASLMVYAIVWQFSPNSPHLYHFVNVLLYAISCLILFLLLNKLFKKQGILFSFVCSLLYAAHPIHSEVVNNIKSLDEILSFLFGISAILLFLNYLSKKSILFLILGCMSFFLCLLSKESGISFVIIIPLILFFFTNTTIKKSALLSILMVILAVGYFIMRVEALKPVRFNISDSYLFNSLIAAPDFIHREATAFYLLLRYIVLLVFPHPLTCDYNFSQIKIHSFGDPMVLLGLMLNLGIGVFAVINIRKKSIIALGILFYLITLAPVSNVFLLIGSTMAERFIYTPSLGFCIVFAYILIKLIKKEEINNKFQNLLQFFSFNKSLFFIVLIITGLYSFKAYTRSKDWKDNLTVFGADVHTSDNSATINELYGSNLYIEAKKSINEKNKMDTINLAKPYLKRALEIYPAYYQSANLLGEIYNYQNNFDSAYYYEKRAYEIIPNDIDISHNFGIALFQMKKYDEALVVLNHCITLSPLNRDANYICGLISMQMNKNEEALKYFTKTIEADPNYVDAYLNRGNVYLNDKKYEYAIKDLDKTVAMNPNYAVAYYNRGIAKYYSGNKENACLDFQKSSDLGYQPAKDSFRQYCH